MAKRKKSDRATSSAIQPLPTTPERLLEDLRSLIREARGNVAQAVNSALVLLYWQVGYRIRTETLEYRRAAYGKEILSTLSKELAAEFGNGFSVPNLSRMIRFAEVFPRSEDRRNVATTIEAAACLASEKAA